MGVKTSLKESTRRKGQLRIDQQKAAKSLEGRSSSFGAEKPKPAPKKKAPVKKKLGNGAIGLAEKLRRRFPK